MMEFTYSLLNDKSTKRKIYILKTLDNGQRLVAAKDMAHQLGCSVRTISSDIHQLKSELPKGWEILGFKTRGYILIKPITKSVSTIIGLYFSESIVYKIILGIFNHKYYTLEKWSQILYMNKATLQNHLKAHSKYFNSDNLKLKSRRVRITGNEINIRQYYTNFFYHTNKFLNQSLLPVDLRKNIVSIIQQNEVSIDHEWIISAIYVSITRFSQKHYITQKINTTTIFNTEQQKCFNAIIVELEKYYKINLPKNEKDELALNFYLLSTSTSAQGELIIDYLSRSNPMQYELYLNLLSIFFNKNNLSNAAMEKFKILLVSYYYKIYISKQHNLDLRFFYQPTDFEESYLEKKTKECYHLVSSWNKIYNNEKFTNAEKQLIATYAAIMLHSLLKKINILFKFSGLTFEKNIIYTKLKQRLNDNVNIDTTPRDTIKYDFIISNFQQINSHIPVIYISKLLTESEIVFIKKYIFG